MLEEKKFNSKDLQKIREDDLDILRQENDKNQKDIEQLLGLIN